MKTESDDLFNDGTPAKDPRQIHCHSIKAFREEHPKLSKRNQDILDWMKNCHPEGGHTDRAIKEGLFGVTGDMNRVRPRVTELIDAGLLIELGKSTDHVTGKTVRVVGLP